MYEQNEIYNLVMTYRNILNLKKFDVRQMAICLNSVNQLLKTHFLVLRYLIVLFQID